jgi:hypothetical protein
VNPTTLEERVNRIERLLSLIYEEPPGLDWTYNDKIRSILADIFFDKKIDDNGERLMACYYSITPTPTVWQPIKFPWTAVNENYIKINDYNDSVVHYRYYVMLENERRFETPAELIHYVEEKLIEARISTQEFLDSL